MPHFLALSGTDLGIGSHLIWYCWCIDVSSCLIKWGYKVTLQSVAGALFNQVGVLNIKVDDGQSLKNLTWRHTYPFLYPLWSCNCDTVPWVDVAVIQYAIHWHLWAGDIYTLCQTHVTCDPVDFHFHNTLPEVFTHPLLMPQWMSMREVITSHWSTLGESGWTWCRATTRPLSTLGVVFLSLPFGSWLNWGGAGTSVPYMVDAHTQWNASFWCNKKKSVLVEDA